MTTTKTAAGARFIDAITQGDIAAARNLLDADVVLTGVTPHHTIDRKGADDVIEQYKEFMVSEFIQSIEVLDDHDVAGRRALAYRVHWSTPEHGPHVYEQHVFYDVTNGGISAMNLLCSGDQPL
jgi:hypothetical protein